MSDEGTPPAAAVARSSRALAAWAGGERARDGYYIPYRHAGQSGAPAPPAWLLERLDAALPRMADWLARARHHAPVLAGYAHASPGQPDRPRFDQDWFTGLDATLAYTMVRELAPDTVLEVGSGHSTRFMARAIADARLDTALVSVDPQPRRPIDALCTRVERRALDVAALPCFEQLRCGDVLFIDGSHLVMPGTDVDLLFTHVLPVLPTGTVVHVHDVFLPDAYPAAWRWRGYNEQILVSALLGTDRFELLAASHWLRRHRPASLEGVYAPRPPGAPESSLWLRVR